PSPHLIYSLLSLSFHSPILFLFLFNDTSTTEIYTLSLHDALPISELLPPSSSPLRSEKQNQPLSPCRVPQAFPEPPSHSAEKSADRKSTRLNSSHVAISYAVFCLKKKKKKLKTTIKNKKRKI